MIGVIRASVLSRWLRSRISARRLLDELADEVVLAHPVKRARRTPRGAKRRHVFIVPNACSRDVLIGGSFPQRGLRRPPAVLRLSRGSSRAGEPQRRCFPWRYRAT